MHDVFVSYSQIDKAVADAVVAGLESEGIRCWVAPRDITPGSSWGEAIVDAIADSKAMALVLSSNSNSSRQVIREVERAVANGVVIVPFRIEDIDPTGAMAYFLATEHWLDALTPPMERHIEHLSGVVGSLVRGEPASPGRTQPPPVPVPRPGRRPPWLWPAVAAATAVVVVTGLLAATGVFGSTTTTTTSTTSTTSTSTTTTTTTTQPVAAVTLTEVGSYRTSRTAWGLDIDGSFLALAKGDDGFTHLSIGDPTEPRPMADYSGTEVEDVLLAGDVVYMLVGEYSKELVVADLAGSGGYGLSGDGQQMASNSLYNLELAGDHLYVGGHNYIGIVYVAEPFAPVLVFEWEPPGLTGNPATARVEGDLALFGAGWDGLYLFDVSEPARPVELGVMDTANWVIDIDVDGEVAFLTLGDSGLAAVDISDPTTPLLISRIELPGFASPLDVADGLAFVGLGADADDDLPTGAIGVVDVSDPAAMEVVLIEQGFESVGGLEVANGHLFMTDTARGLFVYEIVLG